MLFSLDYVYNMNQNSLYFSRFTRIISLVFLCLCCVFVKYPLIFVVTHLTDRYTVGECCLAEETPPVVSSTSPSGHLLLLPDRHEDRARALWPLPQCCHQEEFHSVTPVLFHFTLSRGSKSSEVLTSKFWPRVNNSQVRCWRTLQTRFHLYDSQDLIVVRK